MMSTIGQFYKQSWNEMLQDYIKLISYLNNSGIETGIEITQSIVNYETITSINTQQLNDWLKALSEERLLDYVEQYNKNNPSDHLTLYSETHYRIGKNGLTLNELTNYYANVLYANQNILH